MTARHEARRASPPRVAVWLLERALPRDLRDPMIGDLIEAFHDDALPHRGRVGAALWFWRQTMYAPLTRLRERRVPPILHPPLRERSMSDLFGDLRFALRTLRRRPAFALLATLTLALGIGASTAIFSAAYPILFNSVPYADADRLLMLRERGSDGSPSNVGFATYLDVASRTTSFASVAAVSTWQPVITGRAEPERLDGQRVSHTFLRTLGVTPALGRDFRPDEDIRTAPRVAILSHALWQTRFGADSGIVGKHITLDGNDVEIAGVLGADFENVLTPRAAIYTLLRYDVSLPWACRTCRHLRVIARRKATATTEQAERDLDRVSRQLVVEYPKEYPVAGFFSPTLQDDLVKGVKPALLAVAGAVTLVLLIACLNATNLLLGRGAQRRAEFALRNALGANRARVVRQLLAESSVLAFAGGAIGVALAFAGVRALVALSPSDMPRLGAIEVNMPALLFALGVTVLVSVAFGMVPALQASRFDIHQSIRDSGRGTAGNARRARSGIVVSEVALALVLLVGSGLLLRSMVRLLSTDPGFDPHGMITVQTQGGAGKLTNDTLVRAFFDQSLAAVRAQPGVTAAALTSQLPLSGDFDGYGIHMQSKPNTNPSLDPDAFRYAVSDGYFETMGLPLLEGRALAATDREGSPRVAVVSKAFAARHFPGGAIGERIRVGGSEAETWREIVGVVGDVRHVSLVDDIPNAVYVPMRQWVFADAEMTFVVRTAGDPATLAPTVRRAIWSVDRDQPITRVATMERLIRATAAERRFALVLFESFAVIALVLAATGIYGVLSGSVVERLRELGVRAALGATARDLVRMIVGQGMRLTALGVALGLAGAVVGSRFLGELLFETAPTDAITYGSVVVTLGAVALLACWFPARRAGRVEPMTILRME